MPAPAATFADRDTLLAALRTADILTPRQFAKAESLAPAGSAADAASALVAANLLTRFQADRLLAGRADGFVLGQHIILEQVGRGAMSRVYKARHRTMNRLVAIKVLASDLTRTAEAREAFRREVRAAGKLVHPNIVTAYDANELNDRFYLVLEFVDGPSLDEFVRRRGALSVGEACAFARQVAAGLQHAHEKGMAHRDIKPANLLVARPTPAAPLAVKIADFGIPKAVRGDFAAPELLAGESADHRADLYSLGCVFYFLLTGRSPREGRVAVEHLRPDVPIEVAAIIRRLLAREPAARFASAAELIAQLDAGCVPVAIPVEEVVSFELPAYRGGDSGFLTGREPPPAERPLPEAEPSPWEQITDDALNAGDTVPLELDDDTPLPPARSKPPGRGAGVPAWMAAFLLVSFVLMSLMGVAAVVRAMAK
jgi:serine/threonine-protein kinase